MKSALALPLLALLASASPVIKVGSTQDEGAPIVSSSISKTIANSYIVVFKDHVKPSSAAEHHDWVQSLHLSSEQSRTELRKRSQIPFVTDIFEGLKHTYTIGDLLGYSGHFDDEVIEQVRRHPDVSIAPSSVSLDSKPKVLLSMRTRYLVIMWPC